VCCSVLQCVAVCCSVLQCVAVCCSVLQCVAVCCSVLQCVAVSNRCIVLQWVVHSHYKLFHIGDDSCHELCCSVLQCVAVCCGVLQCVAVCRSVLLWVAVCCSVSQCVAVRCGVWHIPIINHFIREITPLKSCVVLHVIDSYHITSHVSVLCNTCCSEI